MGIYPAIQLQNFALQIKHPLLCSAVLCSAPPRPPKPQTLLFSARVVSRTHASLEQDLTQIRCQTWIKLQQCIKSATRS